VRAVDIFPKIGSGYISSAADLERAFHIAKSVGFTSVGVYTDTAPGFMLHVNVYKLKTSGVLGNAECKHNEQ